MNIHQILSTASQLHEARQLRQAESLYRQALTIQPNHPYPLHMLGLIAQQKGELAAALGLMKQSVTIAPNNPDFHYNLATTYMAMKAPQRAAEHCQICLRLRPGYPQALLTLGNIALQEKNWADAARCYRAAVSSDPNFGPGWVNLGWATHKTGDFAAALDACRRGVQILPDSEEAHTNLAVTLLMRGDLAGGIAEYEWYRRSPSYSGPKPLSQTLWDGVSRVERLLVRHEQGAGDTIQFSRFLPLLAGRVGKIYFQVPSLLWELMSTLDIEMQLLERNDPLPEFDAHAYLMSLPRLLGTTMESLPFGGGYLKADSKKTDEWKARLPEDGRLKVGLAWAGNPQQPHDGLRSIPAELLAPLGALPCHFVSLQVGARSQPLPFPMIDFTSQIGDFADTAALIDSLDLVISVCTSTAHLAGALGKPVWVLLQEIPDWRWLANREDSPWYQSARLFRQSSPNDWPSAVAKVADALAKHATVV